MFEKPKKRHVELRFEKDAPTDDQLLNPKPHIPPEQKVEYAKDIVKTFAGCYIVCRVVDTCGKVAVELAKR